MTDKIKVQFAFLWKHTKWVFLISCVFAIAKDGGVVAPAVMFAVWIVVILWLGSLIATFGYLYLFVQMSVQDFAILFGWKDEGGDK